MPSLSIHNTPQQWLYTMKRLQGLLRILVGVYYKIYHPKTIVYQTHSIQQRPYRTRLKIILNILSIDEIPWENSNFSKQTSKSYIFDFSSAATVMSDQQF